MSEAPAPSKQAVKRAQLAQRIAAHLLESGLSDISLRALATAADTSDRMLIYYFETKERTVREGLEVIVGALTAQLDTLVPERRVSARTLLQRLSDAAADPQLQPIFRLWFELIGRAVRGESPYREIAQQLAGAWLDWIEHKLGGNGNDPAARQRARDLLAQLEGHIMLSLIER